MTARFDGDQTAQQFDQDVGDALGVANTNRQGAGKWLINVLGLALYQGNREGSTVAAVCTINNDKLTYAIVGDSKVTPHHSCESLLCAWG